MKAKVRITNARNPVARSMPTADLSVFSLPLSIYLQNSNAGLLVTDARHRFIWANQVLLAHAAAGPDGGLIINRPFQQVALHFGQMTTDPAAFVARMNELRRKKKPFFGWEVLFTDQHIREISYMPLIAAGRFMGSIWQVVDVTGQKMLRSALEQARKDAAEARGALRTPLNAIIGMAHLLEETRLDARQQEYVNVLRHSSGILRGLISDMPDLSRIRAGELQVNHREFNLAELVHALRYTFELKLGQRPVRITAEIDPQLRTRLIGDDVLLNQILMNLLGNAETVTAEGTIVIRVTPGNWQDNKLWIRFRVCGTDARMQHEEYSAITRQLIELQGGSIVTEELPEFRTCFSFILPFIDTRKPALTGFRRQVDFTGARVLVIEDNPMNLRYIASLLEKYNIDYQLATNGPDALYFLDSRQYDLILLDIRIPGLNGFELADKIRGDEHKPNVATPLVATTALAMESTFTLARQAGITDILTKPYTPDQLLQVLSKYLNDDETAEDAASPLRENVNARFSGFDGAGFPGANKKDMEETTNIPGFEFHRELDVKYLNILYENNIPYAADLFEIFLKTVKEELAKLRALVDTGDWEQLKFQVHKLKPNFAMVGLTWISSKMQQLENTLNSNVTMAPANVYELFDGISVDLEKFYPIIAHEYERMREFIH